MNKIPQYKSWSEEKLKKAIQHLTKRNKTHLKFCKNPSGVFSNMIKTFQEELTQRQKKISGGGEGQK